MTFDLNLLGQGVAIILIAWALKGIHSINGSVKTLMQWKDDHGKQDDDRHYTIIEWLKQLDRRNPP